MVETAGLDLLKSIHGTIRNIIGRNPDHIRELKEISTLQMIWEIESENEVFALIGTIKDNVHAIWKIDINPAFGNTKIHNCSFILDEHRTLGLSLVCSQSYDIVILSVFFTIYAN